MSDLGPAPPVALLSIPHEENSLKNEAELSRDQRHSLRALQYRAGEGRICHAVTHKGSGKANLDPSQPRTRLKAQKAYLGPLLKPILNLLVLLGVWG